MGVVDAVKRLGLALNPQLELQVIGGGVASSFHSYSLAFTIALIVAPSALAALTMVLLAIRGLPLTVVGVAGVGVALIVFVLTLALYISIPSLASSMRRDKLDRRFLLFATMLASRVYSGMGLAEALKSLARSLPPELKDYSLELSYATSLISVGKPLPDALEATARITPSPNLRSLLLGLAAASRTGTGIEEVLNANITEYLSVRETEIERVTSSLGALLEFYTAAAVMLPIALGVVGLLLLFQQISWLSFPLLLAVTTFILVPVTVIVVVIIADTLVARLKG
jgi:flagellar protein FlaJ